MRVRMQLREPGSLESRHSGRTPGESAESTTWTVEGATHNGEAEEGCP